METSKVAGSMVWSVLGMLLLLLEAPFAFAAGLLAPLWAVVALVAGWLLLFGCAITWFRRAPLRVLLLPVVGAVVWFAVLSLGEAFLGWTG